jgi:hypothetical protein
MMTDNRVETIFQDAETLYTRAIEELDRGNIRDAAEKAWGATLRATNALILAKTSKEMEGAKETTRELHKFAGRDKEVDEKLIGRFHTRRDFLHGDCFYMGICEPSDQIERRVRETKHYIQDARKLAGRA